MKNSNHILRSWELNSPEWIKLLSKGGIDSRKVTNAAILKRITQSGTKKILDLGCGEGWLTRSLFQLGFSATGIDATTSLIEKARSKGSQNFHKLSYEEIASGKRIPGIPYDAMVFNFSLYDEELDSLFKNLKNGLNANGLIFIQTIHPYFLVANELEYKSLWIKNSWIGLKGNFKDPHPWFARTLSDWLHIFRNLNYKLEDITEPLDKAAYPASIIFTLRKQ